MYACMYFGYKKPYKINSLNCEQIHHRNVRSNPLLDYFMYNKLEDVIAMTFPIKLLSKECVAKPFNSITLNLFIFKYKY